MYAGGYKFSSCTGGVYWHLVYIFFFLHDCLPFSVLCNLLLLLWLLLQSEKVVFLKLVCLNKKLSFPIVLSIAFTTKKLDSPSPINFQEQPADKSLQLDSSHELNDGEVWQTLKIKGNNWMQS